MQRITTSLAAMRRKMTQKYNLEFYTSMRTARISPVHGIRSARR
jgi:hypothetical protein